ncbi:MAG: type II toxin-antitoxin system VapC family toxin [Eggerthellaceae bacterium]|jgi:tRNA(fMet)-specific endonuclease VapC|nr:type II toxin-antitoxin system VapC family toxin [Eggerthellaceae bacterium]MDR2715222.1 type II toxin-antitoxin system VapC family toxin [Coriobacteriaceae bacterium]
MSWFLDSNICIDCLRGTTPIIKQVLQSLTPSQVKIPSMVKAELFHGAGKSADPRRNRELVELFLAPFEIVAFDDASAIKYGEIRCYLEKKGQIIGFNDLIIAATVAAHGGTLVTANTKEFRRVDGLMLENWAEAAL